MPNHLHGNVLLTSAEAPALGVRLAVWRAAHPVSSGPAAPSTAPPTGPVPRSLGAIVGSFKSATTRHSRPVALDTRRAGLAAGYVEHVVGDEGKCGEDWDYIVRNPLRWTLAVPYGSISLRTGRGDACVARRPITAHCQCPSPASHTPHPPARPRPGRRMRRPAAYHRPHNARCATPIATHPRPHIAMPDQSPRIAVTERLPNARPHKSPRACRPHRRP